MQTWLRMDPQAKVAKVVALQAIVFNFTMLVRELETSANIRIQTVALCTLEALASMTGIVQQLIQPVYAFFRRNASALNEESNAKKTKRTFNFLTELDCLRQRLAKFTAFSEKLRLEIQTIPSIIGFGSAICNLIPGQQKLMSRRSSSEIVLEALLRSSNVDRVFSASEDWLSK